MVAIEEVRMRDDLPEGYWDKQERQKQALYKLHNPVPYVPTYREIENKLSELELEHEILGERYDSLVKMIRKQGKDKVDDANKFLRNYAKEWI